MFLLYCVVSTQQNFKGPEQKGCSSKNERNEFLSRELTNNTGSFDAYVSCYL